MAASALRALQNPVSELKRLLGKKALEAEVPREALEVVDSKKGCCGPFGTEGRFATSVVADNRWPVLTSSRDAVANLPSRGRPPLLDAALVEETKAMIAAMPTFLAR